MINRKEYSDLPAEQKIVYIKRQIIVGFFILIPMLIVAGVGVSMMYAMVEQLEKIEYLNISNQTNIEQNIEHPIEADLMESLFILGWLAIFLVVVFSVIGEGGRWGNDLANKLKLYTDLDLERLEKEVLKIKEVLK